MSNFTKLPQYLTNPAARMINLRYITASPLLFLFLFVGMFGSVVVTSQAQAQTPEAGYVLLERGWVNDAIKAFRQALQRNPQSLDAKLGLATAYQRAGQDAAAWDAYQQVLAQDPGNVTALAAIGQLGSYRPEWQQAGIAALTTLLQRQPENLTARSQRALLYGYQGQFVAAITDYEQILSTNPSSEVLLQAAQVYTYSGDSRTGLTLFEQYLKTSSMIPNNAITAYATALQKVGRVDAAINLLNQRIQSLSANDSILPELQSALAIAYQANQQPQEALDILERLQTSGAKLPTARALSTIARQTQNQNLYAAAIKLYQQELEQTPSPTPGLLTEIADVWSEVPSTRAAALQLYQRVLTEQPDDLALQVKMLWLRHQLGEFSRAEVWQQIQQLIQPLPSSPAAQQQLAQALVPINPPDPALLDVYQHLQSSVYVPFLQFRIAQMELQQGDTSAARQSLAAYRQTPLGTTDPATELLLAEIERQEGDLAASAQRYETLAARYPDQPISKEALRGLAGIRLAQRQTSEALSIYQQLQVAYPDDLVVQLGYMALAYQQGQISEAEATAALNAWLAADNLEYPPELFFLVGALPSSPEREALYDALLKVEPNNFAINRRWVQLWATRDPDKARARIDNLIAENPDRVEVYFVQGELAQAIGDLDLAAQSYETILAKQPNQIDALAALAGVRFQQQRYQAAEKLYQQILAQEPENPEIRRILADLYAVQDQPIATLQQLRQAQFIDSNANPEIKQRLQQLQTQFLRRRGFQPYWERYR